MKAVLTLVLLLGVSAHADPVSEAKRCFEEGNADYGAGRYDEALQAFSDGYALVPNPKFLLNMGQTFRKLGRLEDARGALLKYMGSLDERDPRRADVARVVAEIDLELHGRPAPNPLVTTAPPPISHRARTVGAVLLAGAGAAVIIGGALVGVAVHDNDQIARPPPGTTFDPSLARDRDVFYPTGLALFGVGAALLAGGVAVLVYDARHH